MKENLWHQYPFIGAFVLAGAAASLMITGYYYIDGVPDNAQQLLALHLRTIMGCMAWVAGCGMVSRTRFSSWSVGLLCGLLLFPGLLLLIMITGGKGRRELNPELVGSQPRRQYRHQKALY